MRASDFSRYLFALAVAPVALTLPSSASAQAPDGDGDGVADTSDVCPFVADADQRDLGGVVTPDTPAPAPDGIGDACQCGDVTGEGFVDLNDAQVIDAVARTGASPDFRRPGNCDYNGDGRCTAEDATSVALVVQGFPVATQQRCANARAPLGAGANDLSGFIPEPDVIVHGTLLVNGSPAPAGTVTALRDGVVLASSSVGRFGQGLYALRVPLVHLIDPTTSPPADRSARFFPIDFAFNGQPIEGARVTPSDRGEVRSLDLVASAAAGDRDLDGVADEDDVCPDAFDPDQLDLDADGLGDACDDDDDGDGLLDDAEAQLGTDPRVADSDGDGFPDGDEVAAGSDPLDAASVPAPPPPPPPTVLAGDVNLNGTVDMADLLLLLQATRGQLQLDDAQRQAADLTGDGRIDMADVLLLSRQLGIGGVR